MHSRTDCVALILTNKAVSVCKYFTNICDQYDAYQRTEHGKLVQCEIPTLKGNDIGYDVFEMMTVIEINLGEEVDKIKRKK